MKGKYRGICVLVLFVLFMSSYFTTLCCNVRVVMSATISALKRHSIRLYTYLLTKINCRTLNIRSKADFKSKSQNIWQQIILFSRTVMQMICALPKIWTLSGRLSLMRTVQLMKNFKTMSFTYLYYWPRSDRLYI
jgi:hypothetical protein